MRIMLKSWKKRRKKNVCVMSFLCRSFTIHSQHSSDYAMLYLPWYSIYSLIIADIVVIIINIFFSFLLFFSLSLISMLLLCVCLCVVFSKKYYRDYDDNNAYSYSFRMWYLCCVCMYQSLLQHTLAPQHFPWWTLLAINATHQSFAKNKKN